MKDSYLIIERRFSVDVQRRINALIREGWTPLGGVTISHRNGVTCCAQAVYKPSKIIHQNKDVVLVDMEATLRRN